jgi:hypothetical protein
VSCPTVDVQLVMLFVWLVQALELPIARLVNLHCFFSCLLFVWFPAR